MMKRILSFLILLFAFVAANAQSKIVADKIVGIVGDRIILYSDIKNAIADASRQGGQLPPNPECLIMEQALTSKVLMLQAERDSLVVTEEEIEADLDQRVREFIRMYGSQQALEEIAGKTIYQIKDDARESIKESKLAQSMQRKLIENIRITPNEVKEYFDKIPKDSLPFFESEVEIGQIVVYPKATRDLELFVIDELNNYKRQIEGKTATFESLAKRYSEEPGAKESGGLLPEMNRNEKIWDPTFLAAAFRLKDGEVSPVIKSKFGYHIIQMVQRNGDDAIVRHILRVPPVTDDEVNGAIAKLDSIRSRIVAGTMSFSTAAGKYTEDEAAKFAGPFMVSRDGDTYLTIDELDKEVVPMLDKLKVGELSQPVTFTDERGKKGVRVLYLKTRTEPHRMNVKDDYNKIAQVALEEKKMTAINKWLEKNIGTYYIMIDQSVSDCGQMKKWINAQKSTATTK